MPKKIAIIGAGIAGSYLAKHLQQDGLDVTVYEKARGSGGRLSHRRYKSFSLDHGATFFEINDQRLSQFVEQELKNKNLYQWQDIRKVSLDPDEPIVKLSQGVHSHLYTAIPTANSLNKSLLKEVTCHFESRVKSILKANDDKLVLVDTEDKELGSFDFVISTAPAQQSAELMAAFPKLESQAQSARMLANHVLICVCKKAIKLDFDYADIKNSIISKIIVNSQKPQKSNSALQIVAHSASDWSLAKLDHQDSNIEAELKKELCKILNLADDDIEYCNLHRWLYSRTSKAVELEYLIDEQNSVAIAADWCLGDSVEHALLSANALYQKLTT